MLTRACPSPLTPTLARRILAAFTVAVLVVLTAAGRASAAPPPPPDAQTSLAHLGELTVSAPLPGDDYDRDLFPHWSDQGDSCNTREVVLKRDGTNVSTGSDCYPTSGSWYSVYDGETTSLPSDIDIDHMVPLKNAWISGAANWTTSQREAFANDLTHPQLIAVSDNSNQEKSDQDPSQWKPQETAVWCDYSRYWIEVKYVYDLTITSAEKGALTDMLGSC